jgi:hypothetical protein
MSFELDMSLEQVMDRITELVKQKYFYEVKLKPFVVEYRRLNIKRHKNVRCNLKQQDSCRGCAEKSWPA